MALLWGFYGFNHLFRGCHNMGYRKSRVTMRVSVRGQVSTRQSARHDLGVSENRGP